MVDTGQFKMSPDFLASLNKQMFITSYFLGNNNFSLRGPGSEDPDAFTLQTSPQEEIINDPERQYRSYMWVKGTGYWNETFKTECAYDRTKKALLKISNPDIRELAEYIVHIRGSSINPIRAYASS